MRNDVKPVIPNRHSAGQPRGPDDAGATPGPPAGADFDREHGSGPSRERGDSVDPAGPKRRSVYGSMGTGGAVTDLSGTTGPVSRSNDRTSTTTGRLRDRDMERSARQGEAPDISALDIATGTRTLSVPLLMAGLALLMALLFAIAWFSLPDDSSPTDDIPRAGQRSLPEE